MGKQVLSETSWRLFPSVRVPSTLRMRSHGGKAYRIDPSMGRRTQLIFMIAERIVPYQTFERRLCSSNADRSASGRPNTISVKVLLDGASALVPSFPVRGDSPMPMFETSQRDSPFPVLFRGGPSSRSILSVCVGYRCNDIRQYCYSVVVKLDHPVANCSGPCLCFPPVNVRSLLLG